MDGTINSARSNTNTFCSQLSSMSSYLQHHHLLGSGGTAFGFSASHPQPPVPTYSSLPPPQLMHHVHHSNPALLPLPFSKSASLPSPSPPRALPSHRRAAARAQRRPKASSSKLKKDQQSPAPQVMTWVQLEANKVLVESPPPSSLPMPRFSLRRRAAVVVPTCNAEAMAAEELLQLLRL